MTPDELEEFEKLAEKHKFLKDGEMIFDGLFKVDTILTCGSFGQIYQVKSMQNYSNYIAKVEKKTDIEGAPIQLWIEAKAIYKMMEQINVPQILHVGDWIRDESEGGPLRILVMDLLGESLEQRL